MRSRCSYGNCAQKHSFEAFLPNLMPGALVANTTRRVTFDGMRGTGFVPQTAQWAQLNEHLDHRPSYCGHAKAARFGNHRCGGTMDTMCVDEYVIYLVAHRYPFEGSRPLKSTEVMLDNIWLGRNGRREVGVVIDVVDVIPP